MEAAMPMAQAPEDMPEIHRELTMLKGAFSALDTRTREMLEKVQPVVRELEPSPSETMKLAEDHFPVRTKVGQTLRELTHEIGRLESSVAGILFRIEL